VKYGIVQSHFWDDEKTVTLSKWAIYLFMYLITNKNCNAIGFYVVRPGYAVEDMRLSREEFENAIQELVSKGFALWDSDCSAILMKNYLKHNPIHTIEQAMGAASIIPTLPKTKLLDEFFKIIESPEIVSYKRNCLLLEAIKGRKTERPADPLAGSDQEKTEPTREPPSQAKPEPHDAPEEEIDALVTHWNEICGEKLVKVKSISKGRRVHIRARLKEHALKEWPEIFARVARSPWLTGDNKQGWRADFNWVITPGNLEKIMEGNYDDRRNVNRPKTGMDAIKASMDRAFAKERLESEGENDRPDLLRGDRSASEDLQS